MSTTPTPPPATTVSGQPPAAPAAQPGAAPPAAPPAQQPAGPTREEFDTLKQQLAEQNRATQFWYEKATKGSSEPTKPAAAEPKKDVDLLDLITTRGAEGFDAYMKERGYVSREEVEERVNSKASQIAKETELMGRYPD